MSIYIYNIISNYQARHITSLNPQQKMCNLKSKTGIIITNLCFIQWVILYTELPDSTSIISRKLVFPITSVGKVNPKLGIKQYKTSSFGRLLYCLVLHLLYMFCCTYYGGDIHVTQTIRHFSIYRS